MPVFGRAVFRTPDMADAHAVSDLARHFENSDYRDARRCRLWFRDFAQSSLLATLDGRAVGFLAGYRRPECPDTFMVYRTLVEESHEGAGLVAELIDRAVDHQAVRGARYVEITASAGGRHLDAMVRELAERHSARVDRSVLFPGDWSPVPQPDEVLYRIGPVAERSVTVGKTP